MKKRNAKLAALLAAAMLTGLAEPVEASVQKDENVYATLLPDGSVDSVYVVNAFTAQETTSVTDYGAYKNVKNLSTEEALSQENDAVTLTVEDGKTYYQGELEDAALPWKIGISYTLDGNEVTAQELAGASGHLQIQITIKQNQQANETFFEHYLLQTTVTLDTKNCKAITADGAIEANVGDDRQLLFNVLAGQEKELTIEADVTDFEMDAITFQGVPMQFAVDRDTIDLSALYDKTDSIADAVNELNDGATELSDSAKSAADAGSSLQKGVSAYTSSVADYTDGTDALASGVTSYVNGVSKLAGGAKQLKGLENLGEVSSAVTALSDAVDGDETGSLAAGSSQLTAGLKSLKAYVDQLVQMPGGEAYAELQETVNQLYAGSVSVESGITKVGTSLDTLEKSTASFPQAAAGIKSLNDGFETLQKNDKTLTDGANDIQSASAKLTDAATELTDGANGLSDGMAELSDGASELCAGTGEFQEKTDGIDTQIDDAVDDMLDTLAGNDYEPISFVSAQNTDIGLVQFVIRTDAIEIPEAHEAEAEAEAEEMTFWEKLQALFR